MSTLHALCVRDLTVEIRGVRLVDRLTFHVEAGECVALLGASGSGKSLTTAALLGSLPAEARGSGTVEVGGQVIDVGSLRHRRRSTISMIHQESLTALNPVVRIDKQLTIPLRRRSGLSRFRAREVAAELLLSVGFEDPEMIMQSYSPMLSGGQRQRVCIVQALACGSGVLLADEPTTALDAISQARVLDVLRKFSTEGPGLLFITHDLAAAAALCSRALIIERGRLVESGSFDQLIGFPQHPYTQSLVRSAQGSRLLPDGAPARNAAGADSALMPRTKQGSA